MITYNLSIVAPLLYVTAEESNSTSLSPSLLAPLFSSSISMVAVLRPPLVEAGQGDLLPLPCLTWLLAFAFSISAEVHQLLQEPSKDNLAKESQGSVNQRM